VKHTIPLKITIEVDDTPPPQGVHLREVDGGVVLDVPAETRNLLIQFGWAPPQDGE